MEQQNGCVAMYILQGGKSETSVLPKYEGSTKGVRGSTREYQEVRRITRKYEEVRGGTKEVTRKYEGSTREYEEVRGSTMEYKEV